MHCQPAFHNTDTQVGKEIHEKFAMPRARGDRGGLRVAGVATYPLDVLDAPDQRTIRSATPATLSSGSFAAGSVGPKARAACWFAERGGRFAAIGSIDGTQALLRGDAGTRVALNTVVHTS